eukprot:403358134
MEDQNQEQNQAQIEEQSQRDQLQDQQQQQYLIQLEEKRAYISQILELSHNQMIEGDKNFQQFYYKDAHAVYIQAIEGFMKLLRMTQDDQNFQNYLKEKISYTMDRAEKSKNYLQTQFQNKNKAGYYNQNVNNEALNFLKSVLQERIEDNHVQSTSAQSQIISKIQDLEQSSVKHQSQQNSQPKTNTSQVDQPKKVSVLDNELVRQIEDSIIDRSPNIKWDDIKGLEDVKKILKETIVLPTLRPDIFRGILSPAKGILLYGPPGTGKTMLAKAIATEINCTFFNCSAGTLTSKWMGEGEKLVRALFTMAYEREPAVIFIDEIDSIMGTRGGNEHEASRRLKTEFLVQFDGVNSNSDKKVLVLAATNRPQDLDEAALRRLTRRIYMPLPDAPAREAQIMSKLTHLHNHQLSQEDIAEAVRRTEGYSSADLVALIQDLAMAPIREISTERLLEIKDMSEIRPINLQDFQQSLGRVVASVSHHSIKEFDEWRQEKGQTL